LKFGSFLDVNDCDDDDDDDDDDVDDDAPWDMGSPNGGSG
jgi:hypothetical protein